MESFKHTALVRIRIESMKQQTVHHSASLSLFPSPCVTSGSNLAELKINKKPFASGFTIITDLIAQKVWIWIKN